MELGLIFTTSFILALSGAIVPGPMLTVTIGESIRKGFIAGPLIVLGHGILELSLIIAVALGLSAYITNDAVFNFIAVIGGLFLTYMGYGMISDTIKGKIVLSLLGTEPPNPQHKIADNSVSPYHNYDQKPASILKPAGGKSSIHLIVIGIFTSIANPYFIIWWATIGITYVTLALKSGAIGIAWFFSGHIIADLLWYSLVAAVIAGGKKFFSDKIYKVIMIVCGVFLVGLGLYFLYIGLF